MEGSKLVKFTILHQLCIREAQTENVVLVMDENVPNFLEGVDYQRRVIISLRKHVYLPRQGNGGYFPA